MNILLAGFAENESGSKLLLDLVSPRYYIDKQYINIRSDQWEEELLSRMERKNYEYLFLVHMKQQPSSEETQVELVVRTGENDEAADWNRLREMLEENGFLAKVVEETEEQDAASLYTLVREKQKEKPIKTECLLINIPQGTKNGMMELSKLMTKYFETLLKSS